MGTIVRAEGRFNARRHAAEAVSDSEGELATFALLDMRLQELLEQQGKGLEASNILLYRPDEDTIYSMMPWYEQKMEQGDYGVALCILSAYRKVLQSGPSRASELIDRIERIGSATGVPRKGEDSDIALSTLCSQYVELLKQECQQTDPPPDAA